jgi:surfactin synthase thioesterase subunit
MTVVNKNVPWLAPYKENPAAQLRLFCFPYAGGGAPIYSRWVKSLPPQVEVCPVQLPGRGGRLLETPFTRMGPLVQDLTRELRPYSDKPFAFFGHSMGAAIGFEIARLLRREGAPSPAHLFVSGRRAPQLQRPERPTYNLPEAELIEELRRLKGTPAEVLEHPELMKVLLPVLRADFELIQTYEPRDEPPLDIPLTAFGGLEDDEVGREGLEGWRAHTIRAFSLRVFPGDHFYLTASQQLLLPALTQELFRHGLVR